MRRPRAPVRQWLASTLLAGLAWSLAISSPVAGASDSDCRAPAEPELFAGLVHCCRYCGLLAPPLGAMRWLLLPATRDYVASRAFKVLNPFAVERLAAAMQASTPLKRRRPETRTSACAFRRRSSPKAR